MDKIKLTREQEKQFELFMENRTIQEAVDDWYLYKNNFKELSELAPYEFVSAAIVGYEVEETPEEKILRNYNELIKDKENIDKELGAGYAQGSIDCTEFVLNTLGIKIEGINK